MNPKISKEKQILNHLLSGRTITGKEAWENYGCMVLRERIRVLKNLKGYPIDSVLVFLKNGDHFKKYWLPKNFTRQLIFNF